MKQRAWATLLLVSSGLICTTAEAQAHSAEHEAAVLAGSLAWGFLAFGVAVIVTVALILFTGKPNGPATAAHFTSLAGLRGYVGKLRLFSRNARLYMVHVVGMDVIFGTWVVMFNLYLLAVGFDVRFIGLRILLGSLASALFAVPAGLISDRIGRKLSFVLGDGMGALMALIAISTTSPTLLLLTGVIGGAFGALHGVAEPAFMAENSAEYERVHLFSVADGTRTAAAIIGSALAGLVPLLFAGADRSNLVDLYRNVAYLGIGGWFASLIPAVLLQQTVKASATAPGLRALLAGVKHPQRIWQLTVPEVLLALGAGFVLPLMNVFFRQNLGSPAVEIGATFAAAEACLVVGAFLVPLLVARLGKVRTVVFTRLAAIPFILLLAFAPDLGAALGSVLTVAGLAHIARNTLAYMAGPARTAFAMEILDPAERSTQVGLQLAASSALSGAASYVGAWLMDLNDYRTPFLLMALCLLVGNLLYWQFFSKRETELQLQPALSGANAAD